MFLESLFYPLNCFSGFLYFGTSKSSFFVNKFFSIFWSLQQSIHHIESQKSYKEQIKPKLHCIFVIQEWGDEQWEPINKLYTLNREDQILDTEEIFKTSKKVQYKKNNWMLQKHGGVNDVTGCVIIIC